MTRPTVTDDAIPATNEIKSKYFFHELKPGKCYRYNLNLGESANHAQTRILSALRNHIKYHNLDWECTTRQMTSAGKTYIGLWRTK